MAKRFGVMLDCSRNAVMRVEELKKYLLILKKMGYNMIQLYTEDTYEVDNEPYFGYLRGRYSKAEMKEIVEYCNEIGMEAIPCIQTLAHLNNIFKWGSYKKINDFSNILLVGEERTYELIENMVKTVRECYTTDIIHIGMDEAHMLGLGKYLDKHGHRNRFDILNEHLARVISICEKYNFKPIMWSDMFYRLANNDFYYDWSNITDEIVEKKPDGVDLVYWDYYHTEEEFFSGMLASHMRFSGETWFAGGVWTWMGHTPYTTFSINSMAEAIRACRKVGTDNIFMTLWGDNGRESSFFSVLPALYTIRRYYDGEEDMAKIKAEFYDIVGVEYDDMMLLELPNAVAGSKRENPSNIAKTMLWSDVLFGFLDATVSESAAAEYREIVNKLREGASRAGEYSYIFDTLADLSSVMEIKYDLGKRARDAYDAGDKDALARVAADCDVLVARIEKFHATFSRQWHKENKPHGFEIHDSRYGGLIMRIKAVKARILAYLSGEIATLEELDEKLLPYDLALDRCFAINGTPGTPGIPAIDRAAYALSVNNIS